MFYEYFKLLCYQSMNLLLKCKKIRNTITKLKKKVCDVDSTIRSCRQGGCVLYVHVHVKNLP